MLPPYKLASQVDKYLILENWLIENGSKFPKLILKDYGDGIRGCETVEEIEYNETVVTIPLKCMITLEMGRNTDVIIYYDYYSYEFFLCNQY